jgi:3-oxoacyl-[acyl-carrier protein] reductase
MALTFQQRTAVVTGAGRGIGKAIALQLASAGVKVLVISQNPASCGATAEEIRQAGGQADAYAVDVSNRPAVAEVCARILKEHEKVDILVNNAGITRDNLLLRMSDEDWDQVISTNLSSVFYFLKGLVPTMARQRWGRIINISSVSGVMGNAGQINYSAAKAGMLGLTKSVAREFASRKVTCNAVAPGFIETDMTAVLGAELAEQAMKNIPLKRFGKADEIAGLVCYLASEESGYITGQVFSVDGGMAM